MLQTLAITAPIFLIMALGYGAARLGVFSKADVRVLGAFAIKFALPAMLFAALSQHPIGEILNGRYLLAYALASLAVMAVSFAWGRWAQRKPLPLAAFSALGMANSNSGFIGYPIAAMVVGPGPAAVALAAWFLLTDDPVARTAAIVIAAAPMMSIYPILAQKYGLEGFCAAALLLTTVLSFVTMSVTLWLLGPVLGWAPGIAP
jgi:predicted permease